MLEMTAEIGQELRLELEGDDLEESLEKEWLLTNRRGSYVSGTVVGCNTRRYHGLLVASLLPPVERVVTLSNVLDRVTVGGSSYELANFEFSDRIHPQGYRYLKEFRRDTGVHFRYEVGGLTIEKSIYLVHDQDMTVIAYDFSGETEEAVHLSLVPMVALRDFHGLQSSSTLLNMIESEGVVSAGVLDPQGPAVHLYCPEGRFERGTDWWYAFHYRWDGRRGQSDYEDVWAPGSFEVDARVGGRVRFVVSATRGVERPGPMDVDVEGLVDRERARVGGLIERSGARDEVERSLVKAADQFVVRRQVGPEKESASILAGYHWFADWGRDTFISLPGCLLSTGRYEEACEVLNTFGEVVDEGMIPNRFDDYGGAPHYNSVDASLWFVQAAYAYLRASGDEKSFREQFRPEIAEILEAYREGTRFGIRADDDGLITAGDAETQLTWMDARCNGVSFTPRYGKAVEINALWINALSIMAETAVVEPDKQAYASMAKEATKSFLSLFWNAENRCLNDCVLPDGRVDASIRPNQIFAVSLPFSCLTSPQQRSVVAAVQEHLYTPYGLRSLSPSDSRYQGTYRGDQFQRDSAYHQGTAWGFLMGPFIESYLKVHGCSDQAREDARRLLAPLVAHLTGDACLGSVSEIFDGDFPHSPQGCVAQAWSVAELLRCTKML